MAKTQQKKELKDFHTDRFEIDDKIYIYDFNRIAHNRVERAKIFISIVHQVLQLPPETIKENNVIVTHANQENFWANIFIQIEKDASGNEKEVDQDTADYMPILKAKGKDLLDRKEDCKTDFFTHTRVAEPQSMMRLQTISQFLSSVAGKINLNLTPEELSVLAGTSSDVASILTEDSSKKKTQSAVTS